MNFKDFTEKLKNIKPVYIIGAAGGGVLLYFLFSNKGTMNTATEYSEGTPVAEVSQTDESGLMELIESMKEQFTKTINTQGAVISNLLDQTDAMNQEMESQKTDLISALNSLFASLASPQKTATSVINQVDTTAATQRTRESYLDESRSLASYLRSIDKSTDEGFRNYIQVQTQLKTVQREAANAGVSYVDLARTEIPNMTAAQFRAAEGMDASRESVGITPVKKNTIQRMLK